MGGDLHLEENESERTYRRRSVTSRPLGMGCWSARAAVAVFCLAAGSCRMGGPEATTMESDGGRDGAGQRGDGVLVRGSTTPDGALAVATPDTASILGGIDAGDVTSPAGTSDAGIVPTASGCLPPQQSDVCDPVCNTGCGALRCDVGDQPHTGRCVGAWIDGEGTLCLKTAITDPCAAHLSCVDGACRRLCYRDSDCASPGSCCTQDLLLEGQPSGYKICVACGR
jgi:hypothetical protein